MATQGKLEKTIQVVVSSSDFKEIEAAASRDNRPISNWCRPILVNAAILSRPVKRK